MQSCSKYKRKWIIQFLIQTLITFNHYQEIPFRYDMLFTFKCLGNVNTFNTFKIPNPQGRIRVSPITYFIQFNFENNSVTMSPSYSTLSPKTPKYISSGSRSWFDHHPTSGSHALPEGPYSVSQPVNASYVTNAPWRVTVSQQHAK